MTDDTEPRKVGTPGDELSVRSEPFGTMPDGTAVRRYVLGSDRGVQVELLDYGATVHAVRTPDRDGRRANVALGLATLDGYRELSPYFGSTVGRFANRIRHGRFTLDATTYQIPVNDGDHALHGGTDGFDRRVWDATEVSGDGTAGVRFTLLSPDGEMGFPGALSVAVTYTLDGRGALTVDYRADTDRPTVVNLSNHTYWNLGGEGGGTALDHLLWIDADRYLPIDAGSIPLGPPESVTGTPFDFRTPTPVGARVRTGTEQIRHARGYDHNFVLNGNGLRRVATVYEPTSGRQLGIATDQPGLQFYSGNFLDGAITGVGGNTYRQGDTLVLETQHFPDSPNQPDYPSTVLRPGEVFRSRTTLSFGVA
ncbi:MAG: aldose epimerase family protein [Actinocatenispora sp.]